MMGALDRLRATLRVVLVILVLGLAVAIAGGIVLEPHAPVGFAAVRGHPLLHRAGTGPSASASDLVHFRQHALGIGVRCDGRGRIRVVLHPFGAVESNCQPNDPADGGFVLSDVATDTVTWEVQTPAQNRWSLVLTQPAVDGVALEP